MMYVAGSREGKLKVPVSDVSVLLESPVASFVTETMAPGISAPAGSTTVPEIVPVVVCPTRVNTEKVITLNATTKNIGLELPMFQEPCLGVCTVLRDCHSAEFLIDVFSLLGYGP